MDRRRLVVELAAEKVSEAAAEWASRAAGTFALDRRTTACDVLIKLIEAARQSRK